MTGYALSVRFTLRQMEWTVKDILKHSELASAKTTWQSKQGPVVAEAVHSGKTSVRVYWTLNGQSIGRNDLLVTLQTPTREYLETKP